MENQRPLILISNDDGIMSKGISELIKFLRPLGEIVVMAPDAPRSGMAFETVLDRKPDLVVGGINHGDNSATNVHYSGTMGVVIEGCLKGVPAIGFSLCSHEPDADFTAAGPYVRDIARMVLEKGLPALTCLNVNFPDAKELKGVRICEQAKGQWTNEWENFAHRGDSHYYWLTGEFVDTDADNEKNDHWALANGYVAITPTTVDVTAYGLIDELKTWF